MGAGGLREAGEEGAGGGISKRGGRRVKWEKFCNIGTIFCNRKSTQRQEPLRKGAGTGGAGGGKFSLPCPPPPTLLLPSWMGCSRLLQRYSPCPLVLIHGGGGGGEVEFNFIFILLIF